MGLPELKAALVEARNAMEVADEKSKIASGMAWAMAAEAAGEAGENPHLDGFLAVAKELDKLPRQGFQPCTYYHPDGDYLQAYWRRCSTQTRWLNHLISVQICIGGVEEEEDHSECKDTIVGVQISGAQFALSRSDTVITPDLPNPSAAVQDAKDKGICRVCRRELKVGTAPAAVKERFGSSMYGDSIVFKFGEEYAHQACLNMEAKGVNEGIN